MLTVDYVHCTCTVGADSAHPSLLGHCYKTGSSTVAVLCQYSLINGTRLSFFLNEEKIMLEVPQKQIQKSPDFFNDTSLIAVLFCCLEEVKHVHHQR